LGAFVNSEVTGIFTTAIANTGAGALASAIEGHAEEQAKSADREA